MALKITRHVNLDGSPKRQFVDALVLGLIKGDINFVLDNVADDVIWKVVGKAAIRGKNKLVEVLQQPWQDSEVIEIIIESVMVDDFSGAVNGIRRHQNKRIYNFHTILGFNDADGTEVQEIIHYKVNIG